MIGQFDELLLEFDLMLNIPVNNKGVVGTLPPFNATFTQNKDVMTANKCLKYNHPTKPIWVIHVCMGSLLNHFSCAGSN